MPRARDVLTAKAVIAAGVEHQNAWVHYQLRKLIGVEFLHNGQIGNQGRSLAVDVAATAEVIRRRRHILGE